MIPARAQWIAKAAIIPGVLVLGTTVSSTHADDSGFFGRLFRSGSSAPAPKPASSLPYSRDISSSSGNNFVPPAVSTPSNGPAPLPNFGNPLEGPSTPTVVTPTTDPTPRVAPKPRSVPAVTTADPLITRFALARSNDGTQFGMFLQVFADGTVLDSEGIHYVRPNDLKPILDLVESGSLSRVHGHCGAPSTDYTEYVQIVAFERRLGRLMANQFSYSGNPQGCDHAIRHLHTALENLQAKISRPATPAAGNSAPAPAPAPNGAPVISSPAANAPILLQPSASATIPALPNTNPARSS
jgi:hypothetical protein